MILPSENDEIEVISTLEGTLSQAAGFYYKYVSVSKEIIQKYRFLAISLYQTMTSDYAYYVPVTTTIERVESFLENDGNYHMMQAAMNNVTPSSSHVVWLLNYNGKENRTDIELRFIDYTKTLARGKAVLYGIK